MTARGRVAALSVLALQSCSYPADPAYPGGCVPLELLSSSPAANETAVATDAPIDLWYSDYPDPDTVGPTAVVLTSGLMRRVGSFRVDLLARKVRFVTSRPLDSELTHRLTIGTGLRSMAGCGPTSEQSFTFRTGTDAGPALPVPAASFAEVSAVFHRSCLACHGDPAGGVPAGGLRLDATAREALLGVPSSEVNDLARVKPGDASRSYLMRKLLPRDETGGPLPGVAGARMPPGPPLAGSDLRLISDWIDSGAGAD